MEQRRRAQGTKDVMLESSYDQISSNNSVKALMYMRSRQNYTLNKELGPIGSRSVKSHFLVKDKAVGELLLMSLIPKETRCTLILNTEATTQAIRNLLLSLSHPYVFPLSAVDSTSDGTSLVIIKMWSKEGSLRDLIHSCSPQTEYSKKYKNGQPLAERKIARYGRQILEGIQYFKSKNISLTHLHTSNIIMSNGVCRIADYENLVLGLHSRNEKLITQLYKLNKDIKIEPEVVGFGHILYEMAFGFELDEPAPSFISSQLHPTLKHIIDRIFFPKDKPATIEELLEIPFFKNVDTIEKVALTSEQIQQSAEIEKIIKKITKFSVIEENISDLDKNNSPQQLIGGGQTGRKSKPHKTQQTQQTQPTSPSNQTVPVQVQVSPQTK